MTLPTRDTHTIGRCRPGALVRLLLDIILAVAGGLRHGGLALWPGRWYRPPHGCWTPLLLVVVLLAFGLVSVAPTPALAKAQVAKASARARTAAKTKRPEPPPKPVPPPSYEQRVQWAVQHMQRKAWQEAVQSLGNLDTAKTITPWVARAWFVRATLALHLHEADVAFGYFLKVWHTYPLLADYAGWEIARYYALREDLPALQGMVTALQERYPFSRFVPESQLLLARQQQRFGDLPQARATLDRLGQMPGPATTRNEALVLRQQLGDETGAAATALPLPQNGASAPSPEARPPTILERKGATPFKGLPRKPLRLTPEQLLASLERLADAQLWPEVETRLKTLSKITAPESFVAQVWLKRATLALRQQRLDEAVALLHTLFERYPAGTHLAEGYYLLASAYAHQHKPEESLQHYKRVTALDIPSPWTDKAALALKQAHNGSNGVSPSAVPPAPLPRIPTQEPEGVWEAGWTLYRQKSYALAELAWGQFEPLFPHSLLLPKILYWRARVAHQTNQPDLAMRLYQRILDDYPAQYHSIQARTQLSALGVAIPDSPDPFLPVVPFETYVLPPQAKKPTPPQRPHFHYARLRELQLLQMFEPAAEEVRTLSASLPSTPGAQYFVATLLAESQQPVEAFELVNGFTDGMTPEELRGLPLTFWKLVYPRAYWGEVEQQARTFKVDPYLVASVMRQESVFQPAALSPAGARGLMQIMPATAEELVARLHLPAQTLEQLYDPAVSITLGTHYLASLLQRYQGNLVLTVAAYNAGPGRVSRWREQAPDLPMDEFIELIPIEETRFYVKYVLRNVLLYERLYKDKSLER